MKVVIGLGNAGSQIVKLASQSKVFKKDDKFFTIDSVASTTLDDVCNVESIPIISDEKCGSGRDRERGYAMYKYHQIEKDSFKDMFAACAQSTSPIILVSSAAGGTGSGSIVGLAQDLIDAGCDVIPIIIAPSMDDPASYHMNTSDLFIDLSEIKDIDGVDPGIVSYSVFRNPSNSDYTNINKAVVRSIETILGYHYDDTDKDSIDDSDLAKLLGIKGRFISVYCEAPDIATLKKDITREVLSGYQPAWSAEDASHTTFVTAFSLTSMFASTDFDEVFSGIKERVGDEFERYLNIKESPDSEKCHATAVIAGLPTIKTKDVSGDFNEAGGMAEGIKRCNRPSFMDSSKKKTTADGKPFVSKKKTSVLDQFKGLRK